MGIRKEIKEVLRTMDVRDPRQALVVIESLVNLPKAPKSDPAPSITIVKIGDDEYDVVGNGIPLKGKVYAIGLMWASIGLSCYLVPMPWARAFMLTSAVLVTLYILRQKTLPARD